MGLERELRQWEPLSQLFLNIRNLTREREELMKERTVTKNRLHASKKQAIGQVNSVRRYNDRISMLNTQIEEIEGEIQGLLKDDEIVYKKFKNVITIPGVALITAATIIAETNGFAAILNQKHRITSYNVCYTKLLRIRLVWVHRSFLWLWLIHFLHWWLNIYLQTDSYNFV